MTHNKATIFSNGIADFRRRYSVTQEAATMISIPVKKEHVADVLGSLNVYGHVALKSPPSFRPANELDGNLDIQPTRVIEYLAERLSGVSVELNGAGGTTNGVLVGLHTEQEATAGEAVDRKFLVVMTDHGLEKVALNEMQQLRLLDETVQAEIEKALQRNFSRIKPQSTFVDLAVTTEQDVAEAIVQYTIPAAAWKISYRLRQDRIGLFEFQGFAIVDNNTDEDWKDFHISVVTGEPITFSTDLADSKTPRRKHVNVVKDAALGAVEVEEADFDFAEQQAESAMLAAPAAMAKRASGRAYSPPARAEERTRSATTEDFAARDIGDFCVFESKTPVTIDANRSAVIPVFQTILENAKTVLHYKYDNHPERPYRSVQFANETSYSLGRGVCSVFEGGTFAGSCIMPATKPGGESLLPHALETGVRLRREIGRQQQKTIGLRLSKGFGYTSVRQSQKIVYRVKNNKAESFLMILDHDCLLFQPQVHCQRDDGSESVQLKIEESLANGIRLRFPLEPNEQFTITIKETRIQESSVQIANPHDQEQGDFRWLDRNILIDNGPLAANPAVQNCQSIQQRLDIKIQETESTAAEIKRLNARQERLRKNIATGGHDNQTNRWKADLGQAEDRLVELEEQTVPGLQEEKRCIQCELRDAMMDLTAEWSTSDKASS